MTSRILQSGVLAILLAPLGMGHSAAAAVDKPCGKLEKLIKAGQAPIFGSGDIEKELLDNAAQCLLTLEAMIHTNEWQVYGLLSTWIS